jgi:putative chitinase
MATPFNPLAQEVQRRLKARGHDLGTSGPNRDGIDGQAGDKTFSAMLAELPDTTPHPVPLKPADTALSFAQRQIDLALLCIAFPQNTAAGLTPWVDATRNACVRWGIDTFREVASFLANISVESAGLTRLEENLNYSAKRMAEVWPSRYAVDPKAKVKTPNALANSLANNPEKLANNVYANRMGNGPPASGDGWRYRGFGPKQLTGKDNQSAFASAVGMRVEDVPAFLRTPEGGMMSAGWFWKANNLDAKAATPGVEDDRRAINGGVIGLAEVERIFGLLIDELIRREKAGA